MSESKHTQTWTWFQPLHGGDPEQSALIVALAVEAGKATSSIEIYHSDDDEKLVAIIPPVEEVEGVAEMHANARLIAAAPELADALQGYEAWEADVILNADWSGETPRLTQAQLDALLTLQERRNKALAKATGGSDGQ